jgi:hypothetical protein
METGIVVQEKTNNIAEFSIICSKIYEIRGQKVMLDFDLADMYEVKTKNLNLAVLRNIKRFPPDFMFQLSLEEWNSLRLQNETSKRGGRRYLPHVFTEQGIAQLSSVLNSDYAIDVNINIIRAFIYAKTINFYKSGKCWIQWTNRVYQKTIKGIKCTHCDYDSPIGSNIDDTSWTGLTERYHWFNERPTYIVQNLVVDHWGKNYTQFVQTVIKP